LYNTLAFDYHWQALFFSTLLNLEWLIAVNANRHERLRLPHTVPPLRLIQQQQRQQQQQHAASTQ